MRWVAKQRRERMASWPRFTITLTDRAREFLDYVRNAQDSSASEAIDYLLLKDQPRELKLREEGGILVLDSEDDGPPITLKDIQIIQDEEYVYPRETQRPTPRRPSIRISSEALAAIGHFRDLHGVSISEAVSAMILKSE